MLSVPGGYDVAVHARDYDPWTGTVDLSGDSAEVQARLVPGGKPRVRVSLHTTPPGAEGTLFCVQRSNNSRSPVSVEALCENLEPGPLQIAFRVPGLGIGRTTVVAPEKGEGRATIQVVRGGDLVVPLTAGTLPAIRILDEDGTMWNQPAGLGWPECGPQTDTAGSRSYLCRGLPPGVYTIEVDGQRRGTGAVRPGETTTVY